MVFYVMLELRMVNDFDTRRLNDDDGHDDFLVEYQIEFKSLQFFKQFVLNLMWIAI